MSFNFTKFSKIILYLLIFAFIITAPFYFIQYKNNRQQLINEDTDENWKGVITIWDYPHYDVENETRYGWIMGKIKKFEKEHPGVFIEFKPLNNNTGRIELETAINTKCYPDIVPIEINEFIINNNILEPLDNFLSKDDLERYKDKALQTVRYDNKTWGVPFMMNGYVLVANTDLLKEKGLEFKENSCTYQEFADIASKIKSKDKKNKLYGFDVCIDTNNFGIWGLFLSSKSNGDNFLEKDILKKGLSNISDLKHTYNCVSEYFGENSFTKVWNNFYNKKNTGICILDTAYVNILSNYKRNGEISFNYKILGFPVDNKNIMITKCDTYSILKQSDSKKTKMCVEFLKYITSEKYQRELYQIGGFPVDKSIGYIYINNEDMTKVEDCIDKGIIINSELSDSSIQEIINNEIRKVINEKNDINKSVKNINDKINKYKSNYR